jgi:hypothetical protein
MEKVAKRPIAGSPILNITTNPCNFTLVGLPNIFTLTFRMKEDAIWFIPACVFMT